MTVSTAGLFVDRCLDNPLRCLVKIRLVVSLTVDYNLCGGHGECRRSEVAISFRFLFLIDNVIDTTAHE